MAEQELSDWKELARSLTDDDRVRHDPPPMVWDNIQAALSSTESPPATPVTESTPAPGTIGYASTNNEANLHVAATTDDEVVPQDDVIDLSVARDKRAPATLRKRRRHLLLAGAASILAVVLGLSVLSDINTGPVPTLAAEVNNETLLEPFGGTARAVLELDDAPVLEISFDGDLPSGEPVELWLIKPDLSDMRSLGIVEPGSAAWSGDWPADLDPSEYSVVDLSIEPNDGDPTHSGRSILRGQLTAT